MADGIINMIIPRLPLEIPSNEKDLKHHWIKIYDQSAEYDFKPTSKAVTKLESLVVKACSANIKVEKQIDINFLKKQAIVRIQSAFRGYRAKQYYRNIKKRKACAYMSKMIMY